MQLKLNNIRSPSSIFKTVIAEARRLHRNGLSASAEDLEKQVPPQFTIRFKGCIQSLAEITGAIPLQNESGVQRIIEFASKHLFAFGSDAKSSDFTKC